MNAAEEEKNLEGLIKLGFMKMLDGFPGSHKLASNFLFFTEINDF